jgi:hypothetical protein
MVPRCRMDDSLREEETIKRGGGGEEIYNPQPQTQ